MRAMVLMCALAWVGLPGAALAQEDTSASDECGSDRRCRIARMKRRNEQRRWREMRRADQSAQQFQERKEARERAKVLRRVRPIHASFLATLLGPGAAGGYMINDNWRVEGRFGGQFPTNVDVEVNIGGTTNYIGGEIEGVYFGAGGTYMFRKDWWSPYASAEVLYGTGQFDPYIYDDFGFGGSGRTDVEFHIVGASVGFDLQSEFGLRARLGATVRQPIFAIARSGQMKDTTSTNAVMAWFEQSQRFGFEFGVGWSF